MQGMLLWALALPLNEAWGQECVRRVEPAELSATLSGAERAWRMDDAGAFARLAAIAQASVPCLSAVIDPEQAASLHRVEALAAIAEGGPDAPERAAAALRAAREADPDWVCPPDLCTEGSALSALMDAAPLSAPSTPRPLEPVACAEWLIDGVPSVARSPGQPAVVQLRGLDQAGAPRDLRWGDLLGPDQDPSPPAQALPGAASCAPPVVCEGRLRLRATFAVAGGALGAAALAGGAYGGARYAEHVFEDPATLDAELSPLRITANSLSATAVVGVGVSVGLSAWVTARGCLESP